MSTRTVLTAFAAALALISPPRAAAESAVELTEQVRKAETAFAKTMADRDHAAFTAHLAEEAVFFGREVRRGKHRVAEAWRSYFEGAQAPFSWAPEQVEILASGSLGFTSGPVYDPTGKRVGTFHSVWRREPDGTWKIVFDKGCPPCDCGSPPEPTPAQPKKP